ncbi:MAG: DUF1810 domain-containing protein [Bacteroidota bacterium]|nr:DUF1810 domain-containing protein [Bacteroidota bacterium]
MNDTYNLKRFVDGQQTDYNTALKEVKNGRKQSHWMWYIFPQVQGLGFSETSRYYGIKNKEEAEAFLQHPLLGERLISICNALLSLPNNNANSIFGSPDDLKLKSCATLFASLPNSNPVFEAVLQKFFNGKKDESTLRILQQLK